MIKRLLLLVPALSIGAGICAQSSPQKGRIELLWGWNRDTYSTSDIRFNGTGYDFILYDVRAVDRPMDPALEYLSPTKLTLPQTNLRINWCVAEHYAIGLGFDHMKYVMVQDQTVRVSGTLPPEAPRPIEMDGEQRATLTKDMLTYEHTDGLNYVHARGERRDRLMHITILRLDIMSNVGASAGVLVPRTACRLPGKPLNDDYHLSGFGLGMHAGLRFVFLDRIVLSGEFDGGRIMLPDVRTSADRSDRASQSFWFFEGAAMFGASFNLPCGNRGKSAVER
ncbi:MAG: hypothetical protein IPL52_02710 [Flavobacteriales bacterium]|nr:hypothetical protein [Flavobacteriales bacterium]